MLNFKIFKDKDELVTWFNGFYSGTYEIVSIVKDVTNGEWILWYLTKSKA